MTVQAPDGAVRLPVPLPENALRVQLLISIAWQRGRKVNPDKLLKDVFGHGKSDEKVTPKRLAGVFDSHCKLIRQDLCQAIATLNAQAREVIPPDLDIFANGPRNWWLTP